MINRRPRAAAVSPIFWSSPVPRVRHSFEFSLNMTTPAPAKPQFLLILRQPPGGAPPPDELQKIMAEFGKWMKSMRDKGLVLATNGLHHTGVVLRGRRGTMMSDGPYPESKEIVGGYVLITAEDINQAIEGARDCPGLDNHMAVEVRPVILRPDR